MCALIRSTDTAPQDIESGLKSHYPAQEVWLSSLERSLTQCRVEVTLCLKHVIMQKGERQDEARIRTVT